MKAARDGVKTVKFRRITAFFRMLNNIFLARYSGRIHDIAAPLVYGPYYLTEGFSDGCKQSNFLDLIIEI